MRTVFMASVFVGVAVRGDVIRNRFMHWSNVFTGFVTRTITR